MVRWMIQIFLIGLTVYMGYQYRYRLLDVALSNDVMRRILVSRFLQLPIIRDRMMQSMFSQR